MTDKRLKFPCDCVSGAEGCEESWVRVAKEGMFKDGTKEHILNRLNKNPMTIAQYAKESGLSQPTVHRHVTDLHKHGLIRESSRVQKGYTAEKYYELNFPVISDADQTQFDRTIKDLADEMVGMIQRKLAEAEKTFPYSQAAADGWEFEEFAQYIAFSAQRMARKSLENRNVLADRLHSADLAFMFWAAE